MSQNETGDNANAPQEKQGPKAGTIAVLAVVLPFLGAVAGAILEHGAGFVCQLGIGECGASQTQAEADYLQEFANQLMEANASVNEQLAQCNAMIIEVTASLTQIEDEFEGDFQSAMLSVGAVQGFGAIGNNNFQGVTQQGAGNSGVIQQGNGSTFVSEPAYLQSQWWATLQETEADLSANTFDPVPLVIPDVIDLEALATAFPDLQIDPNLFAP